MQKLIIGGQEIKPGKTVKMELPVVRLYTDTDISLPVHIMRGKKDGPTVFVCAALHGDEINGIEIVRRLIQLKSFRVSAGTLILVPIVNVYGVLNQSRYMPDRRDLNRCFPGSSSGSLAGRVADTFMSEIVQHCDYGIDLHTGAIHRSNLPQIRADFKTSNTQHLAEAFGVPVIVDSKLREGSLRAAAYEFDTKVLVYEAGEALRFDELSILAGVRGIQRVLGALGMVKRSPKKLKYTPYLANHSSWYRANASGIVTVLKKLGDHVEKGDVLAKIGSPTGKNFAKLKAERSGIIIGQQNIPLVQQGDAMFHIAYFSENGEKIVDDIQTMSDALLPDDDSGS